MELLSFQDGCFRTDPGQVPESQRVPPGATAAMTNGEPGVSRMSYGLFVSDWAEGVTRSELNLSRVHSMTSAENLSRPAHEPVDAIAMTAIDPIGDDELCLIAERDAMP